jgi:hypothetical protein
MKTSSSRPVRTPAVKSGLLAFASILRSYVVALIWLLIFWCGLNVLFGMVVGIGVGMQAGSRVEAIRLGGLAALQFSQHHGRLILFLSGLCVSIGMSTGRLLGARRGKPADQQKTFEQAMQIRQEAMAKIERLKKTGAEVVQSRR